MCVVYAFVCGILHIYVCSVYIRVWCVHICMCGAYMHVCEMCLLGYTWRPKEDVRCLLYQFLSYFHETGFLIAPGARLVVDNPLPPTCPYLPLCQLGGVYMAMAKSLCG